MKQPSRDANHLLAHLAMLLFASLIAGAFSIGRLALPFMEPLPLNAIRFIWASLILGAVTFGLQRHPFHLPKALWRFPIIGVLTGIYFVSMFIALTMTSPVSTSAVFTLTPLLTSISAFFILSQRVSPLVGLSLLFAGLGSIWVIFRGDVDAILSFDLGQGELIYFIGCVAYAIYMPLLRRFNFGEATMVLTFFNVLATTLCITLAALPDLVGLDWTGLPPIVWWVLLYLAIAPTAVSFFLTQFATQYLPASKVMAYGYVVPAFVIVYEGLLGNGWGSLSVALGALVTILGLIVLYFAPDSKKQD